MKKIKFLFVLALLSLLIMAVMYTASANEARVVFENAEFEELHSFEEGQIRAALYLNADIGQNVSFIQAVYSGNQLKSVSFEAFDAPPGGSVRRTGVLDADSGETVKAFVLGSDLKPIIKAAAPGNVSGIITSAEFLVGDSVYIADINQLNRTISVNVPYYLASAYGADTVQGIILSKQESMKNASVSFDGIWSEISPASGYELNLLESNTVTVTDSDGNETEYEIVASLTRYNRVYDCEDAVIDTEATASSWNKAYRIGAPKYISSEAYRGDGTWLLEKGSALATSVLSENGNEYINITKNSGDKYTLWSNGNASSSDAFFTEFSFRVNSSSENSDILNVWSSNSDKIVLTSKNMPEGTFTVAHTANDGTGEAIADSVSLFYGEWYTLRFVFKKGDEVKDGSDYVTELYINGALADSFCHGMSESGLSNAGRFISVTQAADPAGSSNTLPEASYPYIAFNVPDSSSADVDIDDVATQHKPTGNETLINYAKVTVGTKTYNADVNTLRKEIVADISDSLTYEQLQNAKVTVSTNGNISPKANGSVTADLTSPVTYTLSSTDGKYKEEYTFRTELSALMRNYDCEGASIDESSGVPSRLSSEKGKKSNWVINKKTNTSAEAADGGAAIETDGTNEYIKVSKNNTVNGIYFSSWLDKTAFDTSVVPNGIFADKFAMEVDFKIDEAGSDNPDYFAAVCSSKEDRIVFSKKDAPEGKYYMASSNVSGASVLEMEESPELSFGEWYSLRYVFRRYAPIDYTNSDWYAVEIYLDGKFITELHRYDPTIAENDWRYMYSGRFNNSDNYAQIFVSLFSEFTGSISLDNFNITYMESWGGSSGSVLYSSDVPTALVISEDGTKTEQLLTLNPSDGTATVYVPYTTSVEQQRNMEGRGAVKPHADVSDVLLVFPEGTEAQLNGRSLGNRIPCNLNEENTLNVDGITYKLTCEFTELGLRYNADGAAVSDGALSSLTGGNEMSGNYGYGDVRVTGASVSEDENGGSVICLTNENTDSEAYLRITQPSANKAAVSNTKIISSFELCVKNASDNSDFASVSAAGVGDVALKSTTDGKYTIGTSDTGLEFGRTYSISYVLTGTDGSYSADVFADSGYICTLSGLSADMNLNTTEHLDITLSANYDADITVDNITVQAVNNVLEDKTVVHLIGDSICCYYGGTSISPRGWGQYLMGEFDSSLITLNHAVGGYNTNIFLKGSDVEKTKTRERWSTIRSLMKEGDYILIALAWNEVNATNGTTKAQYEENIMKMVSEARAAGVTPALVTPHLWVKDSSPHELENARLDYVECIRDICERNNIICLDLNAELVKEWEGIDGNTLYSTYFYSDGLHMNSAGAKLFSDKIISQIKSSDLSLKEYLN